MNNLSKKQYPSNQYLTGIVSEIRLAEMVSIEAVRAMARELLAYREAAEKPVAWECKGILCHTLEQAILYIGEPEPLYAAPQLPAVNSPVIPDGWALVPIVPTEEMMLHKSECQHHAWDDLDCAMRQTRRLVWANMISAAPKPEV